MKARVHVMLKNGVLDPQGKAIANALGSLGFGGVNEVRQGKVIDLDLAESDPNRARAGGESMCQQLLANTVIESDQIEFRRSPLAYRPAGYPITAAPCGPSQTASIPRPSRAASRAPY